MLEEGLTSGSERDGFDVKVRASAVGSAGYHEG